MKNRVCARITIYLLVFVAVAVLTLPPSALFAGTSSAASMAAAMSNPKVLPPPMVYGKTYTEWSVLWWQYFLPLTQPQVNACTIGQSVSNVSFLLNGPSACAATVTSTTSLFFPVANVECSDLEGAPFHGEMASDRESCAFNFFFSLSLFPLSTGTVTLDGDLLTNLLPNYPTRSPDFTFIVGPNTTTSFGIVCGSSPCTGHSTGYGYYLMLAPLHPGRHIIHIVARDYGIDTTWTLSVRP